MYAVPLNFPDGNLTCDVLRVSGKELLTSTPINAGVSGGLKSCYGLVYQNDLLARGECLYRRKRLLGIQAKILILLGGLARWNRDRLAWSNIFTTRL